jgi:hypothetical protein
VFGTGNGCKVFAVAVAVAVGFVFTVVFDLPSPLKPSADGVEGDLRLPTD